MQAYMKSKMPYLGVRLPMVRRVTRQAIDELPPGNRLVWDATVRSLYDCAVHREERYAALVLAGHRSAGAWRDPDVIGLYEHLVVSGGWWDLVDWVAGRLVSPLRRAYPVELNPVVESWAADDDLWLRRTAVLSQLGAGSDVDLAVLSACLDPNLERPEFWLRKACGWALREVARIEPVWVEAYVGAEAERMSGLTRREALRHIS